MPEAGEKNRWLRSFITYWIPGILFLFVAVAVYNYVTHGLLFGVSSAGPVEKIINDKIDSGSLKPQDTVQSKPVGLPPARSATLGYHYSPSMNIHESQEINVFLTANPSKSAITDTLRKILEDEDPGRDPADTGMIGFKEHIPLYKFVTIDLIALDSGIEVRKTPDLKRQPVDTLNGNKWTWSVYTRSADHEESKLQLTVKSEDPDHIENRIIRIRIHVEQNMLRIGYNYLADHPGDLIFKLLVPLIAGIWGIRLGLKKLFGKGAREKKAAKKKK